MPPSVEDAPFPTCERHLIQRTRFALQNAATLFQAMTLPPRTGLPCKQVTVGVSVREVDDQVLTAGRRTDYILLSASARRPSP